jgi:anti-repressor protein
MKANYCKGGILLNQPIKAAQTPIEIALQIDEKGMTTARKLYEFLELAKGQFSRWCKTNIIENAFAEEGIDYIGFDINVEGNLVKDYKLTAAFAKKLSMTARNEKGEQARQYFVKAEDKLKQVAISVQQLSPELQMFKKIFDAVAKQEIEVRQAKEQSQKAIETSQAIKDTIVGTYDNWRDWVRRMISAIQKGSNLPYPDVYSRLYEELEKRAKCRLSIRVDNQRKRMALEGASKTAIENYRPLDVIESEQRLKEIFSTIVREYAVKYTA